jgi:iron(III) transport system substrate-binding protein
MTLALMRKGRQTVKLRQMALAGPALALAAALAAGCSSSTSSPPSSSSSTSSVQTELGGSANYTSMEALYKKAVAAGQKSVVIYGPSAGTDTPLYTAFKKTFPDITVSGVPVVGPPMTAKLSAEMSSGKHVDDIAYTGSTDMLSYIKSGWFTPYKPTTLPPASAMAAESYGPGNNFFGFTVGLSGMVYNTSSVKASQVPTTWTGLLATQWKNKLVMYDPTAIGEMDDIFAHLALVPGDSGLMTGLKAQNAQLSPSTDITGPLTAVAQGAKSLGIGVPYAFYLAAKAGGAPVQFYLLKADNYTVTLYGGIVKGAPGLLAAELYEDWMYTPQAAKAIASEGEYSTVLADAGPAGMPKLTAIKVFPYIPLSGIPAADGAAITQAQHVYG